MSLKETKKRQMDKFIKVSREEIKKYNKTKDVIYLRQAGNKLYNAHIYYLEMKFGKELKSHNEVIFKGRELSKEDKKFKQLRRNVMSLHKWFYEGPEDEKEVKEIIIETLKLFWKVSK